MKSNTSSDALQSSLALANMKSPPFPLLPKLSNLKPLPSSRFFLTLSLGSGEISLAFPPGKFSIVLQEVRANIAIRKKCWIRKFKKFGIKVLKK